MEPYLHTSRPLKYHQLKGKIFSCFGVSWTEYLILNALIELEANTLFPCPQDLVLKLQMDQVWVYRHIKSLTEKGFISATERKYGIPKKLTIGYLGKRLLMKIQTEYLDAD